jgi:hypothetical protein
MRAKLTADRVQGLSSEDPVETGSAAGKAGMKGKY